MLNQPLAITAPKFQEITCSPELQEMWGVESAEEFTDVLKTDYIAKFNFIGQDLSYAGELFVIQSNYLDCDVPAIRLIRGKDAQLVILR
jgi:hypothetical protein